MRGVHPGRYSCEKFSLTSAEIVDVFHHATRASRRGGINKCTKAQPEEDGYLDDGGNGQKMVTDGMKIETVAGEKFTLLLIEPARGFKEDV